MENTQNPMDCVINSEITQLDRPFVKTPLISCQKPLSVWEWDPKHRRPDLGVCIDRAIRLDLWNQKQNVPENTRSFYRLHRNPNRFLPDVLVHHDTHFMWDGSRSTASLCVRHDVIGTKPCRKQFFGYAYSSRERMSGERQDAETAGFLFTTLCKTHGFEDQD